MQRLGERIFTGKKDIAMFDNFARKSKLFKNKKETELLPEHALEGGRSRECSRTSIKNVNGLSRLELHILLFLNIITSHLLVSKIILIFAPLKIEIKKIRGTHQHRLPANCKACAEVSK